ncbi:MAG TPA: TIM barrel protein [Bryobacteraceae bacterium]|nr:TIM barrel protein [Bryobacteraceae bacterium]
MDRRVFLQTVGAGSGAALAGKAAQMKPVERKGRIKQSACRWCYSKIPAEDFVREGARLGLKSIDLAPAAEWPVLKKYGLPPTMIGGGTTIPDGFNRKENHAGIEERFRESVRNAVTVGAPSIIVFSGNRRGMSDEEGLENCVTGLKKIMPIAEDKGILVCMELLNSKVDHADYMCDHTKWGVALAKRVASPYFKLLYDIYHMQIMEGDVIRTLRENAEYIGHLHTGGNPGRNEIDGTQELNYRAIANAVVEMGFSGYMAHEFIPKRNPLESLAEAVELCDV